MRSALSRSTKPLTILCWISFASCLIQLLWYSRRALQSPYWILTPVIGESFPFTITFLLIFALFFFFYAYALAPNKKTGTGIFTLSFLPALLLFLQRIIFALPYYQPETISFWFNVVYLFILVPCLLFSVCLFRRLRKKASPFYPLRFLFVVFVLACAVFLIMILSQIIEDYMKFQNIVFFDQDIISYLEFFIVTFFGVFLYKLLTSDSAYGRFVSPTYK